MEVLSLFHLATSNRMIDQIMKRASCRRSFTLSDANKYRSQQEASRKSTPAFNSLSLVSLFPICSCHRLPSVTMQEPSASYYVASANAVPGPSYQPQPVSTVPLVTPASSNGSQNGDSTRSSTRPAKKKAAKGMYADRWDSPCRADVTLSSR